jgi:hydrogenase/urease accessory protein HupE
MAQAVLRGNAPFFTVPPRAGLLDVVHAYLALGLEHILTGPDHLLFVLGLVLLVRGRQLLWTITAFTLGHSVTLSLAVLGFVHIPRDQWRP